MPPVRWKTLYILILLFEIWTGATTQSNLQDPITMTSDGWRPIIGNGRPSSGYESDQRTPQFNRPSQKEKVIEVEIVKSENPISISSTIEPERETYTNANAGPAKVQNLGNKIAPHSKFTSPKYQTLPPSAVKVGRPSQFGFRKHPLKPVGHLIAAPKRIPVRGQLASHSTRNEVFIHPPGSISIPYLKQGPSNVRTREAQGLGLFGTLNHFTVNQPNAQFEINRFPSINDNIFEQYKSPGVTYIIPKLKKQDEYTRNLVPPPIRNLAEKEKLKNSKIPTKFKNNINEQFGAKTPQIHENLVQIPLGFDQNYNLQKQYKPKQPPAVDVQVTKENLKVFHSLQPNRFKTNGVEYVDYDYHAVPIPAQLPKLQTYEVTEGKWVDNPNPFTYNYIKSQDQSQPLRNHQPIGPPSPNPQITNEPIVELNLPPFLPTPYRPDPAYPTSPTQSEASTVFTQVSKKMNKFKNTALANNPLFFDIKEVSTHYPILGKPEFIEETQTDFPAKENEIADEVTTQRQEITTRKRRRRPQPRPTTPSTTTEEPQQTEVYESQKTQEELIPEVPKRQRRPIRYRLSSTTTIIPEYQDDPIRIRTTTPSGEDHSGEKRLRGRNRHRQRGKEQTDNRNSLLRKRTRPTTTEMPTNHKVIETFESKHVQNTEEYTTKPTRFVEYEDMSSSDEDKSKVRYETTPNQIEDFMSKLQGAVTNVPEETTIANIHNEIDLTTHQLKLEEQDEPTLATTIPTTTSTESKSTTTRPNRIRTRPPLFKSNRPRFSVKDYRQRLSQYTSSTPSTTTDIVKTTSEGPRFRFPSRLRTKSTQSTTVSPPPEEPTTELHLRRRFKPKESRHTTTEAENIIPEANVKAVKTRLRPFDRYKTSTESTKTKISIKPSFYSNRRRPTLKTKLVDKENQTENVTMEDIETTTIPIATTDISDDDYSQRISDLTSSFKTEYDTPGLFKSVASGSRRVPNYFTISTEDPILPIEAFFPGIKDKESS